METCCPHEQHKHTTNSELQICDGDGEWEDFQHLSKRNNTIIFSLQESVVQSSSQCLSHIHLLKIFPDMVIDRWSRMCTCLL